MEAIQPSPTSPMDSVEFDHFRFSGLGLVEVLGQPERQAFEAAMNGLLRLQSASCWWIGDLANEYLIRWGEQALQDLAQSCTIRLATIRRYASVCLAFPRQRRRLSLTFAHHRLVADKPTTVADTLLDLMAKTDANIQAAKIIARHEALPEDVIRDFEPVERQPQPYDELPAELLETRRRVLDAKKLILAAFGQVKSLDGEPGSEHLNLTIAEVEIRNAIGAMMEPYAPCPPCKGDGRDGPLPCSWCGGKGWLVAQEYDAAKASLKG